MAKARKGVRKQNKINLQNLTQRDVDIMTLQAKDVMKKYKIEKQAVYDRRFALNKKIKQAGVSLDQLMGNSETPEKAAPAKQPKEVRQKRAYRKKAPVEKQEAPAEKQEASAEKKETPALEEKPVENRGVMVIDKHVPVIMKPIEITFENFSIKLNGVPKKISVNPDTNAIEIDL